MEGYSEEEMMTIMGHVVETIVKATFKDHFYKWDGQIRRHKKGAAMGVRASRSLSRVCMDKWIKLFKQKLDGYNIVVKLLKKYVDDVLVICLNLRLGTRYSKEQYTIVWSKGWEEEDEDNGTSRDANTMEVLRGIADSMRPFLQFTAEVSEGEDRQVSCLDTQFRYGYREEQQGWFQGGHFLK